MNIAKILCQFRNAQNARRSFFVIQYAQSSIKFLEILIKNGLLHGLSVAPRTITVHIKQDHKISISQVSRPGRRVFITNKEIQKKYFTSHLLIISTPYGLLTNKEVNVLRIGGEIIAKIN